MPRTPAAHPARPAIPPDAPPTTTEPRARSPPSPRGPPRPDRRHHPGACRTGAGPVSTTRTPPLPSPAESTPPPLLAQVKAPTTTPTTPKSDHPRGGRHAHRPRPEEPLPRPLAGPATDSPAGPDTGRKAPPPPPSSTRPPSDPARGPEPTTSEAGRQDPARPRPRPPGTGARTVPSQPLPREPPEPGGSRLHQASDLRQLHDYNPDYAPTTRPTTPAGRGSRSRTSTTAPHPGTPPTEQPAREATSATVRNLPPPTPTQKKPSPARSEAREDTLPPGGGWVGDHPKSHPAKPFKSPAPPPALPDTGPDTP